MPRWKNEWKIHTRNPITTTTNAREDQKTQKENWSSNPTARAVVSIKILFVSAVCDERLYHLRSREQLALIWNRLQSSPSQWAHVPHSIFTLHTFRHACTDSWAVLSLFFEYNYQSLKTSKTATVWSELRRNDFWASSKCCHWLQWKDWFWDFIIVLFCSLALCSKRTNNNSKIIYSIVNSKSKFFKDTAINIQITSRRVFRIFLDRQEWSYWNFLVVHSELYHSPQVISRHHL